MRIEEQSYVNNGERRMDRFSELESFIKVVETGSFSQAAERLNVGKSSISRRVSDLEERLGAQLFKRTTRKLHLTETGEIFYKRCTRILTDLEEAEQTVSLEQTELKGKLKLAAPVSFGLNHLQPVISQFMLDHPNIEFDIDFNDRTIDLIDEGFDLAVRIGRLADSSLIARKLAPIHHIACATPEFWNKFGRPKSPRDLERLTCLRYSNLRNPGLLSYTSKSGETGEINLSVGLLASNGEFIRDIAKESCGFIVEPTFFVYQQILSGELEPVLKNYSWSNASLFALYPPTRQLSNRVRAFVNTLIKRFGNNPYWDKGIYD